MDKKSGQLSKKLSGNPINRAVQNFTNRAVIFFECIKEHDIALLADCWQQKKSACMTDFSTKNDLLKVFGYELLNVD